MEILKNEEVEEQLKFFTVFVAAAVSECDHSLMQFKKAEDQVKAMINQCSYEIKKIELNLLCKTIYNIT
ncbi:hypothetical protein AXF42_Ash004621 [Apostasia shenzhenica]|uniref:Uncharacterized protein n=1 Tax=Apostasia shenzhenica TaxID=1088818 RepID=A0A2I0BH67_9ASPA|nr:hypothetical protein AXF42_Ash004621 [Apostasia shenzhenica]